MNTPVLGHGGSFGLDGSLVCGWSFPGKVLFREVDGDKPLKTLLSPQALLKEASAIAYLKVTGVSGSAGELINRLSQDI